MDSSTGRYVYVKNKKTKPNEPGHWSEKKKMEALTTYLSTGNLRLTSSMLNVPLETVKSWKRQPWWKEVTNDIQNDDNQELDGKLTKLLNKSLEATDDRLTNGEYYVTKTGRIKRIPAKLRDVAKITTDLIEKRTIIRKQHVQKEENKETNEERLLKLAEKFAEFALGHKPKQEVVVEHVIEGEYATLPDNYIAAMTKENNHPIHVKREAGLQEGGCLGSLTQEPQEGQGSKESSQSESSQEIG